MEGAVVSPLQFSMVTRDTLVAGWEAAYKYLAPAIKRGKMDAEALMRRLSQGENVLVHINHEGKLIGAFIYSIGYLDGRRVLRIDLLGGNLIQRWVRYLDHFVNCLAHGAEAHYVEFFTTYHAPHVMEAMHFEEVGILYRRATDGRYKIVNN